MTTQQTTVVEILQRGFPVSAADISMSTGEPQPSIRRCIRELRREGYPVSYSTGGPDAVYYWHGAKK